MKTIFIESLRLFATKNTYGLKWTFSSVLWALTCDLWVWSNPQSIVGNTGYVMREHVTLGRDAFQNEQNTGEYRPEGHYLNPENHLGFSRLYLIPWTSLYINKINTWTCVTHAHRVCCCITSLSASSNCRSVTQPSLWSSCVANEETTHSGQWVHTRRCQC